MPLVRFSHLWKHDCAEYHSFSHAHTLAPPPNPLNFRSPTHKPHHLYVPIIGSIRTESNTMRKGIHSRVRPSNLSVYKSWKRLKQARARARERFHGNSEEHLLGKGRGTFSEQGGIRFLEIIANRKQRRKQKQTRKHGQRQRYRQIQRNRQWQRQRQSHAQLQASAEHACGPSVDPLGFRTKATNTETMMETTIKTDAETSCINPDSCS